jgi:Flp pilus assembly protein TadG
MGAINPQAAQQASSQVSQAGSQAGQTITAGGQQIGQSVAGAGASQAGGIVGSTNALVGGLNTFGNTLVANQQFNRQMDLFNRAYAGGGTSTVPTVPFGAGVTYGPQVMPMNYLSGAPFVPPGN